MTITGGELLLDLFEIYGIEYIFCSPGTEWAAVWEGLLKRRGQGNDSLKYINCRHEMLAVSMAQGYAEATGSMAAVLLHSGVGALSGAMAIRTAYFARAPMLILSGETYEHTGDAGVRPQGFHWLGLLSDIGGPSSLVQGYVKWSNSIKSAEGMIDAVYRGIQIARAPAAGPSFVTVSPELLSKNLPDQKITRPYPVSIQTELPLRGLEEAAKLLIESRRPVILTEYAGRQPGAVTKLIELAELLSIPVFEFFPFAGNFPRNHPLYMGYDASQELQEADTVFVAGSTLPWYPPSACLRDNVKIILLDDDSLHEHIPHWGYRIDLSLTADIERGLTTLVDMIKGKIGPKPLDPVYRARSESWQAKHEKLLKDWQAETEAEKGSKPLSAKWFFHRAHEILPGKSMIVDETILHTRFVHRYLAGPSSYFRPTYGGLGVGFGEAIGVKLANPDRPVVLVIGDGTFNYNPVLAGLGLCQEYKLPLLITVMNNGGYIAMKMGHNRLYPEGWAATHQTYLGVDIKPAPDYVKLAEAFGAAGEKIEREEDIGPALTGALEQLSKGKTVLLDVVVNS
jgi:acetolactate synthase-1/2/3 large subunit